MFASASLDGAIVLWSSHSLSYTRQFNFVKNYEGPSHTYPSSTQHVFTVDQVWMMNQTPLPEFWLQGLKNLFLFFSRFLSQWRNPIG